MDPLGLCLLLPVIIAITAILYSTPHTHTHTHRLIITRWPFGSTNNIILL